MFGAVQRLFVLLIVVLLGVAVVVSPAPAAAGNAVASSSPSAGPAPRPELERRMDHLVAAGAPGVVALINDAGGRSDQQNDGRYRPWTEARGVADLRTQRPLLPLHRFRVASVTKSFVATVALQLVDEGRLSLSDTVERWLPGLLPYGDQVTLRQVLNHTSGVPDYIVAVLFEIFLGDRFRSWQPEELVASIAAQPQLFAPGAAWSYSNTNYVLAGLIIERATGTLLGQEIRRRIVRPLRLRDTSFPVNFPWIAGRHSGGYSIEFDEQFQPIVGPLRDVTMYNPSGTWAAGNIVSDIDDIARFYQALLGGRLLSAARLADMKAAVETGAPGTRYGLGLVVIDTPCGPLFGHTGGIPGFANYAFSTEDGARQFGVMTNVYFPPASITEPFNLTLEQAVQEMFVGLPCAGAAPSADGRTRQDGDLRQRFSALADAEHPATAMSLDRARTPAGR